MSQRTDPHKWDHSNGGVASLLKFLIQQLQVFKTDNITTWAEVVCQKNQMFFKKTIYPMML